MSIATTVADIDTQTLTYVPAVIAGIQAAEVSGASGDTKLQSVVNGILAGSQGLESSSIPSVAGIAALVNLFVSIFNSTNKFIHKPSTAVPASTNHGVTAQGVTA